MPTMISGFSGGGLADLGYIAAGFTPISAVEFDPAICDVYAANIGPHIRCEDITTTDWRKFERPDLLHMSPVCKNASQAKTNGREAPEDIASADAICRALETLQPPAFVLENVVGYRKFKSFGRIVAALDRLGYMVDVQHRNAADFGVPQTRRRLILRAVRGGLVPHLPPPVKWVGWYEAIADLIPTLPESQFAPWQLARLDPLFGSTLVHPTDMRSMPTRAADEPVWTIMLLTHAGLHPELQRAYAELAAATTASEIAANICHYFTLRTSMPLQLALFDAIAPSRGGRDEEGGIFWCDFSELLAAGSAIPQIVGHTPQPGGYAHSGNLICVDAGAALSGLVSAIVQEESDGEWRPVVIESEAGL